VRTSEAENAEKLNFFLQLPQNLASPALRFGAGLGLLEHELGDLALAVGRQAAALVD